jgi:hypothetical protein
MPWLTRKRNSRKRNKRTKTWRAAKAHIEFYWTGVGGLKISTRFEPVSIFVCEA